ncbi:uncharacterized protein LOC112573124 [Pomacea canaliculata]|uniref:uncharacterized protein LOC112573124 n=1 Tax=Pomacea canaliculata TaxID=400727 RepID=UPI000D73782F|nr:uncharacterized protein LOC112573124 [Pomacea canaliculata]
MPTEICSSCSNFCEQDTETLSKLKDLLPEGYQHLICKFCVTSGANDHFEATVRINLFSKDDVQKWKNSFQESSKVTLRIKRTHPSLSTKIMYKVMYRCQHSTQPRSSTADARKGSKNTNCPATTCLTLYQTNIFDSDGFKRKSRSSDSHRADYPALVHINHCHNHAIIAASAIKHRDVSETTKLRLEQLMLQGYAPSAALEMYKYDLQLEHGDDYVYISADRAVCPDRDYVYRLYYKLGKEKYGETRGESQIPQLKEFVEQLEIELSQREFCTSVNTATKKYVVMDITPDDQVVVSICTPLMHRVHKYLKHSSEMVFIDATGNLDRNHCRVFLLLTHSCAGGLPLGVIVTTSESRETIKHALHLLSNLVGSDGFGGRGRNGPAIFYDR